MSPRILPGADLEIRVRRRCALCGRERLTTRTTAGPCCNDCLTAPPARARRPLYATTQRAEALDSLGRPPVRHLIPEGGDGRRTLCGATVREVWDWATPLIQDCGRCTRLAATRPARMR